MTKARTRSSPEMTIVQVFLAALVVSASNPDFSEGLAEPDDAFTHSGPCQTPPSDRKQTGSTAEGCFLGHSRDTVLLGGLFPLHLEERKTSGRAGDRSQYCAPEMALGGVQRMEAMRYAIEQINDNDFIPGVKLAYEFRDTCSNELLALRQAVRFVRRESVCHENATSDNATAMRTLSQHPVSGVVGPAVSGPAIATANLLRLFKVPQISYAATSARLSDKTRFTYFLRTVPSDNFQVKAIASVLRALNVTFLSLLYSADAYGQGGASALKDELQKRKENDRQVCLAEDISIGHETTDHSRSSQSATVRLLAQNSHFKVFFAKPDIVKKFMEKLLRDVKTAGRSAFRPVTWVAPDTWGDQHQLNQVQETGLLGFLRGMLKFSPRSDGLDDFDRYFLNIHPNSSHNRPWLKKFWEQEFNCSLVKNPSDCLQHRFADRNGRTTRSYEQDSKVGFVIDAVYTFASALRELRVKMCENNTRAHGLCQEMLTRISGSRQGAVDGEKLLEALMEVRLKSSTGHNISFTPVGDLATSSYEIQNLHLTTSGYYHKPVGIWERLSNSKQTVRNYITANELEIVECENRTATQSSCTTKTRLWLNISNIQWVNGETGLQGAPRSRCSEDCSAGQHAKPFASSVFLGCCWTCTNCSTNQFTPRQTEVCRPCSAWSKPNENGTSCQNLTKDYWKTDQPIVVVCLMLAIISLAVSLTAIVVSILAFLPLLQQSAFSPFSLIISMVGTANLFLQEVMLLSPDNLTCTVQLFWVGLSLTLAIAPLFVDLMSAKGRRKEKSERSGTMVTRSTSITTIDRRTSGLSTSNSGTLSSMKLDSGAYFCQSKRGSIHITFKRDSSRLSVLETASLEPSTIPPPKCRWVLIAALLCIEIIILVLSTAVLGPEKASDRVVSHETWEVVCELSWLTLPAVVPNLFLAVTVVAVFLLRQKSGRTLHPSYRQLAMIMPAIILISIFCAALSSAVQSAIYRAATWHLALQSASVALLYFVLLPNLIGALMKSSATTETSTKTSLIVSEGTKEENHPWHLRFYLIMKRHSLLNTKARKQVLDILTRENDGGALDRVRVQEERSSIGHGHRAVIQVQYDPSVSDHIQNNCDSSVQQERSECGTDGTTQPGLNAVMETEHSV